MILVLRHHKNNDHPQRKKRKPPKNQERILSRHGTMMQVFMMRNVGGSRKAVLKRSNTHTHRYLDTPSLHDLGLLRLSQSLKIKEEGDSPFSCFLSCVCYRHWRFSTSLVFTMLYYAISFSFFFSFSFRIYFSLFILYLLDPFQGN